MNFPVYFYFGQPAGPNYSTHFGAAEAAAAGGTAKNDHLVSLTIYFKLDAYNHISKCSYNQCSPFPINVVLFQSEKDYIGESQKSHLEIRSSYGSRDSRALLSR